MSNEILYPAHNVKKKQLSKNRPFGREWRYGFVAIFHKLNSIKAKVRA